MKKIQRTICREEAVSRIPGMFAYIGNDANGNSVLQKASDSVDGCYGKVVEAIEVPYRLFVDGEVVIKENTVHTYREVMGAYYAYRDSLPKSDNFIEFVEHGIGEVDVSVYASDKGIEFGPECDMLPERMFISQASDLMMKMRKLRSSCHKQESLKKLDRHDKNLCCDCVEYGRRGGDKMIELLKMMYDDFKERSDEFYGLARPGEGAFSVNVPLTSEHADIGVMTTYDDELSDGQYQANTIVSYTKYDEDGFISDVNTYKVNGGKKFDFADCVGTIVVDPAIGESDSPLTLVGRQMSDNEKEINIEASGQSRLESLRTGRQYINEYGLEVTPSTDEDWLWYYKVNEPRNIRDIDKESNTFTCDYIETISRVEGKLIFVYYSGAKCNAEKRFTTNKGGKLINGCRKYTEEFELGEGSYIAGLTEAEFNKLITTDKGLDGYSVSSYKKVGTRPADVEQTDFDGLAANIDQETYDGLGEQYKKCYEIDEMEAVYDGDTRFPFSTINNHSIMSITTEDGTVSVRYRSADYTQMVRHNETETLNAPVFKDDSLPSFPFRPYVKNDVYIQRGDNAAFERHIRLSEVRTLDDLSVYANGGYYTVESLT